MACSSTIFINGVFALDERIRNYSIIILLGQSTMAVPETTPALPAVAGRPQAVAAMYGSTPALA